MHKCTQVPLLGEACLVSASVVFAAGSVVLICSITSPVFIINQKNANLHGLIDETEYVDACTGASCSLLQRHKEVQGAPPVRRKPRAGHRVMPDNKH